MSTFLDYFRCPADLGSIGTQPELSPYDGFFKFGGSIAFGRFVGGRPGRYATEPLADVTDTVTVADGRPCLPFDLSAVTTNLREERYRQNGYNFLQRTTT